MALYRCGSSGGTTNYRITFTLRVTSVVNTTTKTTDQTQVYEIRDGVMTKISGSNPQWKSGNLQGSNAVTATASIRNITIEVI